VPHNLPKAKTAWRKALSFRANIGHSEWSHIMPRLFGLAIATSIFVTSAAAFAAPALEHVRGTVTSISDTVLVVHTTSGADEKVYLNDKTGYLTVAKSNLDHTASGDYVGIATKSIGSKSVALGVLLFPPAMKGALEGHFDWDPIADTTLSGGGTTASAMTNGTVAKTAPAAGAKTASSMTNGTVSSAAASGDAKQITLTYKGGEQHVLVPPTAPVVTVAPGTKADVTVGKVVFINAVRQDGQLNAAAIFAGLSFL
jgi:hypothetical protein